MVVAGVVVACVGGVTFCRHFFSGFFSPAAGEEDGEAAGEAEAAGACVEAGAAAAPLSSLALALGAAFGG